MRKLVIALIPLLIGSASALAEASTHHVSIESMKFNPPEIEVQKGDVIIWENKDIVPHTVTADKKFDSGTILSGKTYRHVIKNSGEVPYICRFHPTMTGKIKVKP